MLVRFKIPIPISDTKYRPITELCSVPYSDVPYSDVYCIFLLFLKLVSSLSAWDQSENFVKIYLTDLKNVQSLADLDNDFEFKVTNKSVHFVAKNLDGRNCVFEIKETAGKLNPEKSEFKVKSSKIKLHYSRCPKTGFCPKTGRPGVQFSDKQKIMAFIYTIDLGV